MKLPRVARPIAAVRLAIAVVAAALVVAPLALGGCSSNGMAAAPGDFCSVAKSSNTTCKDPSACDTQLGTACSSLPTALSATSVAAAKDCLESGVCGVASCVSRSSKSATPTEAHKKLAEDFCRFCAPSVQDCVANFYKRGAKSPGLVVLPYSEDVVRAVDDACTGQSGCQAKFTTCALDTITSSIGAQLDAATADCILQALANHDAEAPLGPDGRPQAVTCTPANCVGCCRDDKCEKGDSTSACGAHAKGCEVCSPTAKCTAGACKEPCGANTCAGCCSGDTCVGGTAKDKCGSRGAACAACAGQFVCSNHSCIDGSCLATCTNGCCSATGCQTGNTANACGTGGEGCIDCGVGRTCSAASCILDRTSLWDLYVSFAVLPDKNKQGKTWSFDGVPDPYLKAFSSEGASVHSGQTLTIKDTTFPFWAETPLKSIKASEFLANLSFEIWNEGIFFDDYMGGCALAPTPAIFDGSLQNIVCAATASGVEVKLYFRINSHAP